MNKFAVTFGLVVILVVGTFGGMVIAAPQQTPSDCCDDVIETGEDVDYVVTAVDEIGDDVSETGEDVDYVVTAVDEIGDDVSETGEDVDYVVTAVDEIGADVSETGEDVDYVVTAVDEIGDDVSETGEDVDYVVTAVDEIGADVSETGEDVDYVVTAVGTVVRMDTDYGIIEIPPSTKPGTNSTTGGDYDEIRHVVVTLYIDGTLDEGDDRIDVRACWPENLGGCIVATFSSGSDDQAKTIEFNADKWTIDCESGRTGFTVKYVVTSTYVPAVPQ